MTHDVLVLWSGEQTRKKTNRFLKSPFVLFWTCFCEWGWGSELLCSPLRRHLYLMGPVKPEKTQPFLCLLGCTLIQIHLCCKFSHFHKHIRISNISSTKKVSWKSHRMFLSCLSESRRSENDNIHRLHGRDLPGRQSHRPVELQGAPGRLQRLRGQVESAAFVWVSFNLRFTSVTFSKDWSGYLLAALLKIS